MKVVVTGGAGFIGSHIVDALVQRGASVVVIDSLDPGVFQAPPTYLNAKASYCFSDLRHWIPDARFDDVDAVVHLAALGGVGRAAKEPENILGANCGGTARLMSVARGWTTLKRIVIAGSFSIYGSNYRYRCPACAAEALGTRRIADLEAARFEVYCPNCATPMQVLPITEDARPMPLETYGASKYMQELCFQGFSRAPVSVLRFSSVYGDRLRLDDGEATIIAKIAGWIGARKPPTLFEDGNQIRDWVYVGDVVDATLALLDGKRAEPVVNVCSGVPTTLKEACAILARVMRVDCTADVVGGFRPGDMRHCLGDTRRLSELLGRSPRPFAEGAALVFGQ